VNVDRPHRPDAPAPALRLSGLAKSFGTKRVLHPFDLDVAPGEVHALLGQNGSGKSTLIKLLSGFHLPDAEGVCEVAGQQLSFGAVGGAEALGLRFVHQDLGLVATQSVLDNLALGRGYPTSAGTIRHRDAVRRARSALEAVGLDVDVRTPVAELSPAQRTGVAIARAMQATGDAVRVMVLDEPTATLPVRDVERLHDMLRTAASRGVGIVYVTHHLDEVFALADRVSVLRDGHLVATESVSAVDRDRLVHLLIGGEVEAVARDAAAQAHPATTGEDPALRVRELTAPLVHGLDLDVAAGEVVGLYGLTGSGRESVLGLVFGARRRDFGTVCVGGREVRPDRPRDAVAAGLGYVPPDRKTAGGLTALSAAENLTLVDLAPYWRRGWLSRRRERADAQGWMDRLDVRPAGAASAAFSSFSGGNQQKLVMGKWLRREPRVLLLDEPTQGVDVGAKAQLHRQVLATARTGTAVLVSSSDVEELATICDRVLVMREGRVAESLTGAAVTEHRINASFHRAGLATQETIASDA
jgi:ribose transport system ATP-binding protein